MRLQEDPYPDLPPRDAPVLEPLGPAPPEVYRQVYGGMARANANEAVKVMELEPGFYWMGSPDDAATEDLRGSPAGTRASSRAVLACVSDRGFHGRDYGNSDLGTVQTMMRLSLLPAFRVICVKHPDGPLVLQLGVEPTIETECRECQEPRIAQARRDAFERNTRWQKWRAQTPEQIAAAPDPFKGFRKAD